MNYLVLVCAALIQFSSAQVLSYVSRNAIPQQAVVANIPNAVNNAKAVPSNAVPVARVPNAVPVASTVAAVNPGANLANANIVNANLANNVAVNANPAHIAANPNYAAGFGNAANYANANYANAANANYANVANANAANANYASAANYANAAYPSQNYPNTYGNSNTVVANSIANANLNSAANANLNSAASANLANANLANGNVPTINGNMATFNLGQNGNTFTVTSGSPGAQGFGISVMADALEVGGTVAVNGQIPIFGTVAVNGNVPTDGSASVSYNCGGKQVPNVQI